MEDEEHAHRDVYFQEKLESLKASMTHLTSLLEQILINTSSEGPSNQPHHLCSDPNKNTNRRKNGRTWLGALT
jgi:hypothetical protein